VSGWSACRSDQPDENAEEVRAEIEEYAPIGIKSQEVEQAGLEANWLG